MFPAPSVVHLSNRLQPQYAMKTFCTPSLDEALCVRVVTGSKMCLGVNHGGNVRPLYDFFGAAIARAGEITACTCDDLFYVTCKTVGGTL